MLADEEDDMYEFTPADYYRVLGPKKQGSLALNYLFIHSLGSTFGQITLFICFSVLFSSFYEFEFMDNWKYSFLLCFIFSSIFFFVFFSLEVLGPQKIQYMLIHIYISQEPNLCREIKHEVGCLGFFVLGIQLFFVAVQHTTFL